MRPYAFWTNGKDRPALQLLCVGCGAVRPTLHLPEFRADPITQTFGPLLAKAFSLHREQMARRAGES